MTLGSISDEASFQARESGLIPLIHTRSESIMSKLISVLTSSIFVACVSVPAWADTKADWLQEQLGESDGGFTTKAEEAYEAAYMANAKECKSKNLQGAERRACLKDARAKANAAARAEMKPRASK
jgi:hypothetical protein